MLKRNPASGTDMLFGVALSIATPIALKILI